MNNLIKKLTRSKKKGHKQSLLTLKQLKQMTGPSSTDILLGVRERDVKDVKAVKSHILNSMQWGMWSWVGKSGGRFQG